MTAAKKIIAPSACPSLGAMPAKRQTVPAADRLWCAVSLNVTLLAARSANRITCKHAKYVEKRRAMTVIWSTLAKTAIESDADRVARCDFATDSNATGQFATIASPQIRDGSACGVKTILMHA